MSYILAFQRETTIDMNRHLPHKQKRFLKAASRKSLRFCHNCPTFMVLNTHGSKFYILFADILRKKIIYTTINKGMEF